VINTFALGSFAMGKCGAGQPLAVIANQTGGACTEVLDPSTLAAILPSIATTQITDLTISVNGAPVDTIAGSELSSMSLTGVDINTALMDGVNTVDATAIAADGTQITASIVVNATECPPPGGGTCPHTQGFWKTHPQAWPVMSLDLGGENYTQTEAIDLFNTPVRGDASVNLGHQLMAAKLNLAVGSDPAPIQQTIADSDAILMGGGRIPQGIASSSATGQSMTALASMLDDYNNGLLTGSGCTPLGGVGPAQPTKGSKGRGRGRSK